ncbi:hypothetical protein JDV02_003111 [Purpureocillium takamizusanense]|uniref:Uncharacterized protein n=1 Tax=Purpureocillium takamizusanense TaxID=2060973 RepID=A0A9Q8V9E5_9HYPO|nr:uncharacterized protein JDV02_003111 [Purpureocillium takamizusanense]UNI16697.1 hypothetical protein JDV02_003111 [Purpureocillium takamizusanense]
MPWEAVGFCRNIWTKILCTVEHDTSVAQRSAMNPSSFDTPVSDSSYSSHSDFSSCDDQQPVVTSGPQYSNVMLNAWPPGPIQTGQTVMPSVKGDGPEWHEYYSSFVPNLRDGGIAIAEPTDHPREAGMPPGSTSGAVAQGQPAVPTVETRRVQVTERHMADLEAKADEDHFKSFTDELEKSVRVALALNPQTGIHDDAERKLLTAYLANPDSVNEASFRVACCSAGLGGGDLETFNHLITFTHQISASLKHIALYIQTCLQGDADPNIPSSGDLRKMLLFIRLILPSINELRLRTAPVEGWNPTSGFFYGQ